MIREVKIYKVKSSSLGNEEDLMGLIEEPLEIG